VDGSLPAVLSKLPERCMSREPTTGRLVLITRGQSGFRHVEGNRSPEDYNRAMGLSYEQVEAMEYGALVGFDAELADPARVREQREAMGLPVGPIRAQAPERAVPPPPPPPKPKRSELPEDIGNFAPWFNEALAQSAVNPRR
jgi:hypothetical protein